MKLKTKNRTKARLKINYQLFESFLLSLSIILLFFSFAFEKTGVIIILAFSFMAASSLAAKRGITRVVVQKDYLNLDVTVALSMLFLFCNGGIYQSVICVQIYSAARLVFDAKKFFAPKAVDVLKKVKEKKYHIVHTGDTVTVSATDIKVGDMLELYSGETVPVDGIVKAGTGTINTVNITGDSKIISVSRKDKLRAGYTFLTGNVILEVTKSVDSCLMEESVNQVNLACKERTKGEQIKDLICNIISAVILVASFVLSIYKCVVTKDYSFIKYGITSGILASSADIIRIVLPDTYKTALYRCLTKGIIIRKKSFIENTLSIKGIYFEAAGVLTSRDTVVSQVYPATGISKELLVKLAAYGQCRDESRFFNALTEFGKVNINYNDIIDWKNTVGGTSLVHVKDDIEITSGSAKALRDSGVINNAQDSPNILCVAVNGNFIGYVEFDFDVKQDIRQCIDSLRFAGIKNIAIITNGLKEYVNDIAVKGGIEKIFNSDNSAQLQELKRTVAENSVLFAAKNSECVDIFNTIHYGYCENDSNGCVLTDNLNAPVNYVNIVKDSKVLMSYNFLLGIAGQVVLVLMAMKFTQLIWLMIVLITLIKILQKINCVRLINEI